jgi:RND family efflux transporter MFP subunit
MVERIVGVEGLRRLVRLDLDRLARSQEPAGHEKAPAERRDAFVQHDLPEDPTARDERVDALGAFSLEVVPAAMRAEVEAEHAADLGEIAGGEKILDDGVAVPFDTARVLVERKPRHRLGHLAEDVDAVLHGRNPAIEAPAAPGVTTQMPCVPPRSGTPTSRRSPGRALTDDVSALGALLLVLAVAGSGCSDDGAGATARPKSEEPRPVRLVAATAGSLARTVTATGTLAAEDQVVLNTKVAGRLAELPVDLGSVVRHGDVVAVLDLVDFRLQVEQASTALAQARARLGVPVDGSADQVEPEKTALVRQAKAVLTQAGAQRIRLAALHRDGILSKAELDQADAEFRVAEARYQESLEEVRSRLALVAERRAALQLAEQSLADATLRAPFDGAVRERHLSIGAYLAVGAPVVTIVRLHPLRLRLAVPEREASGVRAGQPVHIRPEGDGVRATGKVVRLSPAIDERTRTLMVEAEIPNDDGALRPGAFANADIVVDPEETAVLVPADALVTFAGVTRILGVADGRIVEKRVRVGRRAGDRIEVLEGLTAGDAVVAQPGNLTAGQPVVVQQ